MEKLKRFQITTASLNTTPLDFSGNLDLHKQVLTDDAIQSSSIVLFPELSLSGYGCEDAFYRPLVWEKSIESVLELLPFTKDRLVVVGLPIFYNPYLYDSAIVLQDGLIRGIVPKKNLANTGIHYEKRWFSEWKSGVVDLSHFLPELAIHTEESLLFGDLLFDWGGLRVGLEICEDSWALNRPSHDLAALGVDLILSPGASHFAFGKYETRSRIFQESSRAQSNIFAFSNLIGNESGRTIFDGGNIIASCGKTFGIGKRLALGTIHLTQANLDLEDIQSNRVKYFRESGVRNRVATYEEILIPGSPFFHKLEASVAYQELPKTSIYTSFTNAVILGLFDYLRKSGTKGFTLSLSGGADSSAIAILVKLMEEQVKSDLGLEYWSKNNFTEPLLTTIYQKTKNNSPITKEIARDLASDLGADHHEIEIDEEVELMVNRISQSLGRKLNWQDDDLALQNIQARVRSPLVWLLANTKNHILLSTGNRSEAAVGYTTMDGDSSGSLSPIAGVSKQFLLEWLHYLRSGEDKRFTHLSTLDKLLETRPSAELKPLTEEQEDEKDLMPYSILQKIESLAINQGKRKSNILEILLPIYENYSPLELGKMIDRFFHLFRVSQWKRERLPASFHLDEYGIDPKSSYRYPILSGLVEE